jgi:hypothetical protein
MVKLKCWGKAKGGHNITRFKDKQGILLEIYKENIYGKNLFFVSALTGKTLADKEFSDRKSAVNFANRYMKKHDKC